MMGLGNFQKRWQRLCHQVVNWNIAVKQKAILTASKLYLSKIQIALIGTRLPYRTLGCLKQINSYSNTKILPLLCHVHEIFGNFAWLGYSHIHLIEFKAKDIINGSVNFEELNPLISEDISLHYEFLRSVHQWWHTKNSVPPLRGKMSTFFLARITSDEEHGVMETRIQTLLAHIQGLNTLRKQFFTHIVILFLSLKRFPGSRLHGRRQVRNHRR